MIIAVADTHAAIWYLSADSRLSATARLFIEAAVGQGYNIALSAISLIEMVYLVEKGRIPPQRFSQLAATLGDPDSVFVETPVTLDIARALSRVDVTQIPDMPDRIVAATAVQYDVPIISRDGKIRLSTLQTIW